MDIYWKCFFHSSTVVRQYDSTTVRQYDNTIALVRRTMEQGIIVAMKLCKLISSPDSEMDRGPQHAGKAGVGSKIYDLLQGKIDQGHIILYNGAPQNPLSIAIIIVMCLIKNSKLIIATITFSIQQDTIHGPKIVNTNRESMKGFPKEVIPMETEP
jgi:hypothetical protein